MSAQPLTGAEFSAAITAITSAFGDPTRREIYLFARDSDGGVTAGEVAERFKLHPNVARHHLDKLAAGGYLDVNVGREHAGAGRPSKRYRATSGDLHLPPRRDDLLVSLLGRALASLPRDAAEELAEQVGEEYGRSLALAMSPAEGHRSRKVALQAVAEALTAHGFAAHAEARGGGVLAIINEHCPFGTAAQENPVVCAVDRGIVKGMLGVLSGEAAPNQESSRARGDSACVTLV